MDNIINTAKVDYTVNGLRSQIFSNTLVLPVMVSDNTLKGRVITGNNCSKWVLNLINKNTRQLVYSMQGCHSRNFSFNVNPAKEYTVEFKSDSQCTLRLYNTPDAVTNIIWNSESSQ